MHNTNDETFQEMLDEMWFKQLSESIKKGSGTQQSNLEPLEIQTEFVPLYNRSIATNPVSLDELEVLNTSIVEPEPNVAVDNTQIAEIYPTIPIETQASTVSTEELELELLAPGLDTITKLVLFSSTYIDACHQALGGVIFDNIASRRGHRHYKAHLEASHFTNDLVKGIELPLYVDGQIGEDIYIPSQGAKLSSHILKTLNRPNTASLAGHTTDFLVKATGIVPKVQTMLLEFETYIIELALSLENCYSIDNNILDSLIKYHISYLVNSEVYWPTIEYFYFKNLDQINQHEPTTKAIHRLQIHDKESIEAFYLKCFEEYTPDLRRLYSRNFHVIATILEILTDQEAIDIPNVPLRENTMAEINSYLQVLAGMSEAAKFYMEKAKQEDKINDAIKIANTVDQIDKRIKIINKKLNRINIYKVLRSKDS